MLYIAYIVVLTNLYGDQVEVAEREMNALAMDEMDVVVIEGDEEELEEDFV